MRIYEFAHDFPEGILRVGVVLVLFQGFFAGHAAEDQHSCICISNWGETADEDVGAPIQSNLDRSPRRKPASGWSSSMPSAITLNSSPISAGLVSFCSWADSGA